jgi:hypothetical protein
MFGASLMVTISFASMSAPIFYLSDHINCAAIPNGSQVVNQRER